MLITSKCEVFVELRHLTLCLISLSLSHAGSVDVGGGGDGSLSTEAAKPHAGDKRHSTGNSANEPAAKKSSVGVTTLKSLPSVKKTGIAFSLGATKLETAKKPAPPIKLKLGERVIIRLICLKLLIFVILK